MEVVIYTRKNNWTELLHCLSIAIHKADEAITFCRYVVCARVRHTW